MSFAVLLLQSRGADPSILTEEFEPYLSPGRKTPVEVEMSGDEVIRAKLLELEEKYKDTPKASLPTRTY